MREAVELPAELDKAGSEIITTIYGWLDQVNELMRQWVWLNSLSEYVKAVQAGRNPGVDQHEGRRPAANGGRAEREDRDQDARQWRHRG